MATKPKKCPCYFHMPLNYNPEKKGEPGVPIEPEKFEEIMAALDRQFHGYTDFGVVNGCWHGLREPCMRVMVAVEETEIESLKFFIKQVGNDLGQEEMYFEQGGPSAELI